MKITAVTPGFNEPSSRFRIRQHIPKLKEKNIHIREFCSFPPLSYKSGVLSSVRQRYVFPLSGAIEIVKLGSMIPSLINSYKSDLVWMNRPAHNLFHLEKYFNKNVLFDIDDAIWLNDENKIKQIAKNVYGIIAGNSFIADWFTKYNKNIFVVPTAIDTDRFIPGSVLNNDERFIIGWTGSADGLKFIYEIENQLSIFIKNHDKTYIKIICDKKPKFKTIASERILYIPWNPQTENTVLQDLSVGIMPLTDDDWSRGKCSFKMLQYMSTAIPVVVSDVGMNSEVLDKGDIGYRVKRPEDWQDALTALLNDEALRKKMGGNGRSLIEKEYSVGVIADQLSKIFNDVVMN